jgi:hypothetical protein
LGQSESFLPETGAFVADNEDVEVILFVGDKVTRFFQSEFDVLLVARKKIPTRSGVEFFSVVLELWRLINELFR